MLRPDDADDRRSAAQDEACAAAHDAGAVRTRGRDALPQARTRTGERGRDEERDVDWVAGAFMLVPRQVYEATGGFDERSFMYGEDLEWCQRISEDGWRIRYFHEASIIHADHSSSNQRWDDRQRLAVIQSTQRQVYLRRHGLMRTSALMADVSMISRPLRRSAAA